MEQCDQTTSSIASRCTAGMSSRARRTSLICRSSSTRAAVEAAWSGETAPPASASMRPRSSRWRRADRATLAHSCPAITSSTARAVSARNSSTAPSRARRQTAVKVACTTSSAAAHDAVRRNAKL